MDKNPKQELKDVLHENRWERTNKNKKFLKKPTNKTAKKQFFKELRNNSVVFDAVNEYPMIDTKILRDLETCAKILQVADHSKKLDLEVVELLSATLCLRMNNFAENKETEWVEMGFEYARHGLLTLFFEIFIKLRERAMKGEKMSISILWGLLGFFNTSAMFKRTRKVLRNTKNFEVISQPHFWEPIFFQFEGFFAEHPSSELFAENFKQKILHSRFCSKILQSHQRNSSRARRDTN
jgi:hypothetical protein